jgi:uncharacterized protein (UPF0262 family)
MSVVPEMKNSPDTAARLERVVFDGAMPQLSPLIEADRLQAVADLVAGNHFAPQIGREQAGPYALHLSVTDVRLMFDIRDLSNQPITIIGLALGPFRRLIKDYQLLVDSHILAVQEGREARIQAIDMGRRGLHNEGAELMMQRLAGKIAIDFDTARRLFTLVCALAQRVAAR